MGANIDMLKGEFTKTPEQLTEKQLGTAKTLANIFSFIRRAIYFFFDVSSAVVVYMLMEVFSPDPLILNIVLVFLIVYSIFKIRDLLRGTI
jgi:hypothetical protein